MYESISSIVVSVTLSLVQEMGRSLPSSPADHRRDGVRTVLRIVVPALLLPAAAGAQTLRYEAGHEPATYRRAQTDRVVQTVAGQQQRIDIESFWRFTVETTAADDGLVVRIVHDSLGLSSVPAGADSLDFSALIGEPVIARMDRRGEVREVTLPDPLPPAAGRLDLATAYRTFFPVLPEGRLEAGDAWADTVRVSHEQNGVDIAVTRIDRYTARGLEEVAGRRAARVDYVASFVLEGRGSQNGAEVVLTGTGGGEGTWWFDPGAGVYLGGDERSRMRMEAFVAAGPGRNLLIPIVQERTESIELVAGP